MRENNANVSMSKAFSAQNFKVLYPKAAKEDFDLRSQKLKIMPPLKLDDAKQCNNSTNV